MNASRRLLDLVAPPADDLTLVSLVATTYELDWEFVEEEWLPVALGVRSPVSRQAAYRSELERRLDRCDVTILYDLGAVERCARLSPRIDPLPVSRRKLHAKITLLLWAGPLTTDGSVRQYARLILGSANLTHSGFHENFEVVAALNFFLGRAAAPRRLLTAAVDLVAEIAEEAGTARLADQLERFRDFARDLAPAGDTSDQPWRLVTAHTAVDALVAAWRDVGEERPESVHIVSPFWPEGERAGEAVAALVRRFGAPGRVEIVCESSPNGTGDALLPLLPGVIPRALRAALTCPVLLRPSTGCAQAGADAGAGADRAVTAVDPGDRTEDDGLAAGARSTADAITRRSLHAKVIAVCGRRGTALYIGSSNCTRRGLALADAGSAGATNFEAGFVYRLPARGAALVGELLACAGPPIEVPADGEVATQPPPPRQPERPVPNFLHEVVAAGSLLSLRFRADPPVPKDLRVLLPDRLHAEERFVLLSGAPPGPPGTPLEVALADCARVDAQGTERPPDGRPVGVENVGAVLELHWNGHMAHFPVRFDDRSTLPPVPGARHLTGAELIEYFLTGREPWSIALPDDAPPPPATDPRTPTEPESAVDTRRILSYLVRRFVEAIPGIEAEVQAALPAKPALEAALFGPTSPVKLAERTLESLRTGPPPDEPRQTPMSVAFQIIEITAVLRRCRARAPGSETRAVLDRAIEQLRAALVGLAQEAPGLAGEVFQRYRRQFAGEA